MCLLCSCLKCSVSCGTGIQVRKIECIANDQNSVGNGAGDRSDSAAAELLTASGIAAGDGALTVVVGGDGSSDDDISQNDGNANGNSGSSISIGNINADEVSNDGRAGTRNSNNKNKNKNIIKDNSEMDTGSVAMAGSGAGCDPNSKPTEMQQCTTGIACTNTEDDEDDGSDEHYDNEHISSEVHELQTREKNARKQGGEADSN